MPVEEVGLIEVALDLDVDDWGQILFKVGDDFGGQALDSCVFDPVVDVVGGLDSLGPAGGLPVLRGQEALAHVFDLDVIDERGEGRLGELLLHEGLALLSAEF